MQQFTIPKPEHKAVGVWLLICCAMVFVMVILGGLTRLTHSGLSMVEWQLTTILPPMSVEEWQAMFDKYRMFPEFQKVNIGMTLEEFQGIFWLEFIHRNWGRTIGFVFLLPFVWFAARRVVDKALAIKLAGLFLLGGAQGGMGWFMVKSGLVDNPDVSQYRLTAHLCLAVIILGALLWVGLSLINKRHDFPLASTLGKWAWFMAGFTFLTIVSGGFVAGTDAGFDYNTFPLMDGAWIPDGLYPGLASLFEDIQTIQFDHRVLAISTLVLTVLLWASMYGEDLPRRTRLVLNLMLGMAVVQVGLGISTLLLVVPVHLASAHQGGALVLLGLTIWLASECRRAG